jgi:hypothetical protein
VPPEKPEEKGLGKDHDEGKGVQGSRGEEGGAQRGGEGKGKGAGEEEEEKEGAQPFGKPQAQELEEEGKDGEASDPGKARARHKAHGVSFLHGGKKLKGQGSLALEAHPFTKAASRARGSGC